MRFLDTPIAADPVRTASTVPSAVFAIHSGPVPAGGCPR